MSPSLPQLVDDLRAESADLDARLGALEDTRWRLPTPAPGWTIAHQVAHLAWGDDLALLAVKEPTAYVEHLTSIADRAGTVVDETADTGALRRPSEILDAWRDARERVTTALVSVPDGARVPWFGAALSGPSMVTARLMETWAHGYDIADALGQTPVPTGRLRHIAHLGVRTRAFSFAVHGDPLPAGDVRVELIGPDSTTWVWGEPESPDRVVGPALDFCLLVTQRRHRDDLAVQAVGPTARRWLEIAQAYAGPPGDGRPPTAASS